MKQSISACPFCGGTGIQWANMDPGGGVYVYIRCEDCGAQGPAEYYGGQPLELLRGGGTWPDAVIEKWNSRSKKKTSSNRKGARK